MPSWEGGERRGIEKMPTGIEGFDELAGGGLPLGRTTLILGGAGTGKTVFALQTLVNGARDYGEPGIFVAFEESSRQVIQNAATFGWDIPGAESKHLFFLDARLTPDLVQAGNFDLVGMLASLKAKADDMGAKRIVFDSIDVLLTMIDNRLAERQEVYRLRDWLCNSGLTGIITSGTRGPDPLASPHYDFMQFLADCVVLLHNRLQDQVLLREMRIVKYRGSSFAANEHPMSIGNRGIAVATVGAPDLGYQASSERVSTGIERLDAMLEGGYYRGSSTLITGSPGTAKSTVAGAFVLAACRRGERALYVSFDEGPEEIIRNLSSVNLPLAPQVRAGLLRIVGARSQSKSAEEHLIDLRALIAEHQPRCVVIDPVSAMLTAGGRWSAVAVVQRLLYWTKAEGITLLVTSLLEDAGSELEATDLSVSTVADTWIHLTYVIQAGERNRALTIVKSRGTAHSNQVRELILSRNGVNLSDVYTAGGEVMMGTMRWEREQSQRVAQARARAEQARRERDLEEARAEAIVRIEAIKRDLARREAELQNEIDAQELLTDQETSDQLEVGRRRKADASDADPAAGIAPSADQ